MHFTDLHGEGEDNFQPSDILEEEDVQKVNEELDRRIEESRGQQRPKAIPYQKMIDQFEAEDHVNFVE